MKAANAVLRIDSVHESIASPVLKHLLKEFPRLVSNVDAAEVDFCHVAEALFVEGLAFKLNVATNKYESDLGAVGRLAPQSIKQFVKALGNEMKKRIEHADFEMTKAISAKHTGLIEEEKIKEDALKVEKVESELPHREAPGLEKPNLEIERPAIRQFQIGDAVIITHKFQEYGG